MNLSNKINVLGGCDRGQLDSLSLSSNFVSGVVLLQELSHSLGVPADGVGLPLVVGTAGVCLVEARGPVVVEARDETGDTEGSSSVGLCVPLLEAGHVSDITKHELRGCQQLLLSHLVMYSRVTGSSTVSLWD